MTKISCPKCHKDLDRIIVTSDISQNHEYFIEENQWEFIDEFDMRNYKYSCPHCGKKVNKKIINQLGL